MVMPTYDRADLLSKAVDSVLGQTYEDFELIVVDDGSGDGTLGMLAGYADPRLRVVPIEHCGIPGKVRNTGLRVARGKFVAFLDSDDIWLPTKLARQVEVLLRRSAVGLACSNAGVIDAIGVDSRDQYLGSNAAGNGTEFEHLLRVNFIINSSVVVRRTLVERVGSFSEAPELRHEDYDLWLRIAAVSEVVYLPETLMVYREHLGSVRRGFTRCEHWIGLLAIMDNLDGFLEEEGSGKRELIRPRRAEILVHLAIAQAAAAQPGAAVRSLAAAVRCDTQAATTTLLIRPILYLPHVIRQGATTIVTRRSVRSPDSSEAQR